MTILEKARCTTVTPISEEHTFFSTLLILGFNVTASETQHKISFKPDMFKVPCKKGAEVILHFLLTQLDPDRAKTEFSMCWPAWDAKKEHQYRKCVFNWLTELHRDADEGVVVPRINTSTLTRAAGPALITLLDRLGALVLQRHIKGIDLVEAAKFSPTYNPARPHMAVAAAEALYLETKTLKQKLVDTAQVTNLLRGEWQDNAKSITDNIQRLSNEKKALEAQLVELDSRQRSTLGQYKKSLSVEEQEQLSVETQHKASQLRGHVKKFYEVSSRQAAERQVVGSVMSGSCNAHNIDAEQIPLQVPSVIIPHYQKRLAEGQIGNTYKGGKVDLVALTQLANMSLKLMGEELEEGDNSSVPPSLPSLHSSLRSQDTSLTALTHSLDTLSEQSTQFTALLNNTVNQALPSAAEQELKLSSPMPQYSVPAHPSPNSATLLPHTPGPPVRVESGLSRNCTARVSFDKGKSVTVHRSRSLSSESGRASPLANESRCPLSPVNAKVFESPIAGAKVRVVQQEQDSIEVEDLEESEEEEVAKVSGFGNGIEKLARTPPPANGSHSSIGTPSPPSLAPLEDSCNLINNLSCDLSLLDASFGKENMSILN